MTLLIYAKDAQESSEPGQRFLRFIERLQADVPGALLLPISEAPPHTTRPHPALDWLSIPCGAPSSETLGLLGAYADWFRPVASLFVGDGSEARSISQLRRPPADVFGQRWHSSPKVVDWRADEGSKTLSTDELIQQLRRDVPVSVVLEARSDPANVLTLLAARPEVQVVRVYCGSAIGEHGAHLLDQLIQTHPGRIQVHLRLDQGLARGGSGLKDLRALYRRRSRLNLEIRAEKDATATLARVLSRAFGVLP
jgi:hypothetical protein